MSDVATAAPRVLHDKQAAAYQLGGITERTLDRLIKDGEIDAVKIGRRVFVPHDAIVEYVERLRRAS